MLKPRQETVFAMCLALVTLVLIGASVPLSARARLVPLSVLVPAVVLIAAQLVLDLAPGLPAAWRRPFAGHRSGAQGAKQVAGGSAPDPRTGPRERRALGWVLAAPALVYLVGLAPALPLFALAYVRQQAGGGWHLAIGMAAVSWAVLHMVFGQVLGACLYMGLLWRML